MSKRVRQVAYHEAGHAVLALNLQHARKFQYVTVKPTEVSSGHVFCYRWPSTFHPDLELTSRHCMQIDDEIVVLFAGSEALRKLGVRYWRRGAQGDFKSINGFSTYRAGNGESCGKYLEWLQELSRELTELYWDQIVKVADTLIERQTLERDDVMEIINPGYMAMKVAAVERNAT